MFLFQTTKMLNNIILTDIFFLQSENLGLALANFFCRQLILANRSIKLNIFHGNSLFRDQLPRTKQNGSLLFINSLVGEQYSFDRRDRSQSIEIVPLLSCSKDIMRHKSLWQFQDVKNEVDLILARAAMFTVPQNVNTMTICSSHRSSLAGLGWTRATERCRTHPEISEHRNVRGNCLKLTAE